MSPMIIIIAAVVVLVLLSYVKVKTNNVSNRERSYQNHNRSSKEQVEYIPEELEEHLRTLKRDGRLIQAIKDLRDETGMGLAEAKQFIDDLSV
jgi:hypothetical protein